MRYIKTLQRLQEERSLNYSLIPKKLLQELLDEELVKVEYISGSRRKVVATSLFDKHYGDLEQIASAQSRAELTKAKVNTKKKKISPQEGLYLNGNIVINGVDLSCLQKSALFVKELPKIKSDVVIVGVENFENLVYAKEQFKLFKDIKKFLFVFRNKKMLKFIEEIENRIIYFGDYDLAGIFTYKNEIQKRVKDAEFFFAENLEYCIKEYGDKKLFEKQINKYKNLQIEDIKLQNLIDFINKEQKVLEQEFFIEENKNG